MSNIFVTIIVDHLLSCPDGEKVKSVLSADLSGEWLNDYSGGRIRLLNDLHWELGRRLVAVTDDQRPRIAGSMTLIQAELGSANETPAVSDGVPGP